MNTYYGVWSPISGILPDITDLDFGAYYIIDSGTLNSQIYEKDTWLLYICEKRGTPNERSFWRISKGVILINPDSHTNVPNSGWYTKVRLDNAGNIVAGSDIEYNDLPQELKESLEQITDENLNIKIENILKDIFKNNLLNPIQLEWDPITKKIFANLKLDEDTISINEFGQLTVIGGSSGSTIDLQVLTEDLEKLKQDVEELKNTCIKLKPIAGKGIEVEYDNGGSTISCLLDESSIVFNEFGELSINPNILQDYIQNPGTSTPSQNKHTSKDITDFVEAVNKLLKDNTANILAEHLKDIVDEVTIIVNNNGKLEAIASGTAYHTHKIKDIVDLDPEKANTWASSQTLHKENQNQDFNAGSIMMSTLTIGEILIAFNELFKEQKDALHRIEQQVGTLQPIEPCFINEVTFIPDVSNHIKVVDIHTKDIVLATKEFVCYTNDIIYLNGTKLNVYIDNVKSETIDVYDKPNDLFHQGTYGNFEMIYVGDAYPKIKTFQGYYRGYSFKYTAKNIEEGKHTLYFETESLDGQIKKSEVLYFNIYEQQQAECSLQILKDVDLDEYTSGIKCTKTVELLIKPLVKNYKSHFAPYSKGFFKSSISEYEEIDVVDYSNGYTEYITQSFTINDFYGNISFDFFSYNFDKSKIEETHTTSKFINIDDNKFESYRVHQIDGDIEPAFDSICNTEQCDSSKPLIENLINECVIKDGIAHSNHINYVATGIGPDYSSKPNEQVLLLKFNCPKDLHNFYFDLVDSEKNAFKQFKNGTLQSIKIYVSFSDTNAISTFVNCNEPYPGYGKMKDGIIHNGLDLFRSTDIRRWITLGKNGFVSKKYLYIKFIFNGTIHLPTLINSIEDSLNERR